MDFSFVHMWESMGFIAKSVVYTLALMSVGTFAIAIERLVAFLRASGQSKDFALAIRKPLEERDFGVVAQKQKAFVKSPLAQVVGTGVAEYDRALGDRDKGASYAVVEAAQRASERAIDSELAKLRRGLGVLATVGSTAPFVGLFGTVFGIINAFQSMSISGSGGIGTVAAGIAEALITTGAGIGVAVIAVWFFNYLLNKIDIFTGD